MVSLSVRSDGVPCQCSLTSPECQRSASPTPTYPGLRASLSATSLRSLYRHSHFRSPLLGFTCSLRRFVRVPMMCSSTPERLAFPERYTLGMGL